jgi:hypothetical protein
VRFLPRPVQRPRGPDLVGGVAAGARWHPSRCSMGRCRSDVLRRGGASTGDPGRARWNRR